METAFIQRDKAHLIKKQTPILNQTVKQEIPTLFRPLQQITDYEPKTIDPHYEQDPYWSDDLYNQEKLEYKNNFNKPPEQIEEDDILTDPLVSDKLRYALIDLWTVNPQLPITSSLPNFATSLCFSKSQKPVKDPKINTQLQSIPGKNTNLRPLLTNLQLKNKKRLLYFAMDFGELTIDGLIDTSLLTSSILEADLRKILLLVPQTILFAGALPDFQILVANGDLERPSATVELQFEIGDISF